MKWFLYIDLILGFILMVKVVTTDILNTVRDFARTYNFYTPDKVAEIASTPVPTKARIRIVTRLCDGYQLFDRTFDIPINSDYSTNVVLPARPGQPSINADHMEMSARLVE